MLEDRDSHRDPDTVTVTPSPTEEGNACAVDEPNPPNTTGNSASPTPTPDTTTATPGDAAGTAPTTISRVTLTLGPPPTSTANTSAQPEGDPTYVLYPYTTPSIDTGHSNRGAMHSTTNALAGTDNMRLERAKVDSSRKRKSNNVSSADPTKKQKQSDALAVPTQANSIRYVSTVSCLSH